MDIASRIVEEPGMGRVEIFTLSTEQDFLFALLKDAFEVWWRDIVFGSLVQGAVFENPRAQRPAQGVVVRRLSDR